MCPIVIRRSRVRCSAGVQQGRMRSVGFTRRIYNAGRSHRTFVISNVLCKILIYITTELFTFYIYILFRFGSSRIAKVYNRKKKVLQVNLWIFAPRNGHIQRNRILSVKSESFLTVYYQDVFLRHEIIVASFR